MTVIGVNYKDTADKALGFLSELGDPYTKIGADTTGRTGIDWGIYGVPETFVVAADGTILLRHPGPLTEAVLASRIRPAIEAAQ
jgi:cytochrome c biogenesis protein CcmG/thiol:disulfide interchange protein DsbE